MVITMASVRTFDTLGYAKFLAEKGVEPKVAEALAEANYEYLVNDLATKEFVHNEIERAVGKLENKITSSENKMMRINAAMLAFAVGILLAGIPIIQAVMNKLG